MARTTTAQRRTTRQTSTRRGANRSTRTTRRSRPSTRATSTRGPAARRSRSRNASVEVALQRFFDDFSRDLTSGDGRAAAARFEYPAVMIMSDVGKYGGNQVLQDEGTVASFFDKAPEQYHAKGIEQTTANLEDIEWIAPDLALVRVRFPYLDAQGDDMGDGETSVYVVRKTGLDFAICTAVTLGTDGDRATLR